ncbi:hypothetical protein ATANTOWER_006360, partial [Ataeniobius toweri]|nr:hypothetical protein [Ataeniobius toweri]
PARLIDQEVTTLIIQTWSHPAPLLTADDVNWGKTDSLTTSCATCPDLPGTKNIQFNVAERRRPSTDVCQHNLAISTECDMIKPQTQFSHNKISHCCYCFHRGI